MSPDGGVLPESKSQRLEQLKAEFWREHEASMELLRRAVAHARKAGETLLEMKQIIGHGQWLTWEKKNINGVGERTLQVYQQIAQHCVDNPDDAVNIDAMTIDGALHYVAGALPNPQPTADLKADPLPDPAARPTALGLFPMSSDRHDRALRARNAFWQFEQAIDGAPSASELQLDAEAVARCISYLTGKAS
jgi:hypothetical protein